METVSPYSLIPVLYEKKGNNSQFVARNCGMAIEKLCWKNLLIKNPCGSDFTVTIELNYAKDDKIKLNKQTLKDISDLEKKSLVIRGFHKHKGIPEESQKDCLSIDSSTAMSIAMGPKYSKYILYKQCMNKGYCWHKITVIDGAKHENEHVMKLIMETVSPYKLIPVLYEKKGNNSHFVARDCGEAIEKLCRQNLLIKNPGGSDFTVTVELNYTKDDKIKLNKQALQDMFDLEKKSLDIRNKHKETPVAPPAATAVKEPPVKVPVPVKMMGADTPGIPEESQKDCLIIDSSTALSIAMGPKYSEYILYRKYMNKSDCWHKITVIDGAKHENEHVIELIMETVSPYSLIPVLYEKKGNNSHFVARNCGRAIEKLCWKNLLIKNPRGSDFTVTIELNYTKEDKIELNRQALQDMSVLEKKSLDIRGFYKHKQPPVAPPAVTAVKIPPVKVPVPVEVGSDIPAVPEVSQKDCLRIDCSTAMSIAMGPKYSQYILYRRYMNKSYCWHKITVIDGAKHENEHVMKLIMETVSPYKLIPLLYEKKGNNSHFLTRDCGEAIEKLCGQNLLIKNPHGSDFTVTIELNYARDDKIKLNRQALQDMFDLEKKSLDIRNKHKQTPVAPPAATVLKEPPVKVPVEKMDPDTPDLYTPVIPEVSQDDCVSIDSYNKALSIAMGAPYILNRKYMNRRDCWHKITVINGAAHKDEHVMKLIIETASPHSLNPVLYEKKGKNSHFVVRNCGSAIEKLCKNMLLIKNPRGPDFTVMIELNYAKGNQIKLNTPASVTKALHDRYDPEKKSLDLRSFHKHPHLANLVFCPLSDPKILQYVLLMSKKQYDTNIIELNLASNNIEDIRSLEMMTSIQHLDLRNNSIDNIEKLESLQRLSILTLWLDGNPVCENYDTHAPYIKEVKRYVTTLKRLDGVLLGKPGFTLYHRNFLVDGSKHAVVDHFLGHYFNLYDSGDRLRMKGLYNSHSLFSLTAVHLTVQSISSKERLTRCMGRSRNLLKKEPSIIHHGEDNILAIFQHLPSSKHDPYSFTVDTAYVKDKMLSVYVCGVFQEPSETKVPLIRSFSRMFMLLEVRPNEFQVINEMLHVSNATTAQAKEAFKYERPPIVVPSFAFKAAQNLTDVDKSQLVYILADVTEMNSQWSQKCLEEANWDFKDALVLFTELYKRGGVPAAAFIK